MEMPEKPLPDISLTKISQEIFKRVKNHDCLTCFFVEGAGRRTLFNYYLKNTEYLKHVLGAEFDKTVFLYINPDEIFETTSSNYLLFLLNNIVGRMNMLQIKPILHDQSESILETIKKNLDIFTKAGYYIVFLFNDFEYLLKFPETLFRNLEAIMSVNKNQINFIFLASINLLDDSIINRFHNLKYAITQNAFYLTISNDTDTEFLLKRFSEKSGISLDDEKKKLFINLFGGHPQLIKYCLFILKDNEDVLKSDLKQIEKFILENYQLRSICHDIWNSLNEIEKKALINININGNLPSELVNRSNFILKTGIVMKDKNKKYKLFGKLFSEFVKQQTPKEKLTYDSATNQLYYGGDSLTNKFTLQEFKLLVYFIKNQNKVITRDEVGEILWGKNYVEKFSDWSIDKIISVLRKKLTSVGYPAQNLVTLKRRGFSFSNPE